MSTAKREPGGFMAFIKATPGAEQLPEVHPAIGGPPKGMSWLDAVNASAAPPAHGPAVARPLHPGAPKALDAWLRAITPPKV